VFFSSVFETCLYASVDNGNIYFLQKCVVSADFKNSARTYLTEFANDTEKVQMPLPKGLTYQEEFYIREISNQLGLIFRTREQRGEKMVYISKPQLERGNAMSHFE
jgi:hypothetical protein